METMKPMNSKTTKTRCHSKTYYLGIDPASDGAAILLDENGVVALSILWKKIRRKKIIRFELRIYNPETNKMLLCQPRRFSEIGKVIADAIAPFGKVLIASEDSYFRPNPKVTITVSRLSGLIVGPIENYLDIDCEWIKASMWRHSVLRLNPFTKREQAKNASLKMIPTLVKGMSKTLNKLGRYDHITDAGGVAYWLYQKTKNP